MFRKGCKVGGAILKWTSKIQMHARRIEWIIPPPVTSEHRWLVKAPRWIHSVPDVSSRRFWRCGCHARLWNLHDDTNTSLVLSCYVFGVLHLEYEQRGGKLLDTADRQLRADCAAASGGCQRVKACLKSVYAGRLCYRRWQYVPLWNSSWGRKTACKAPC